MPLSRRAQAIVWLISFAEPYKYQLCALIGLSVLGIGPFLAQPYITRHLIDNGLLRNNWFEVLAACLYLVSLSISGFFLQLVSGRLHVLVSGNILFKLREAVFFHLMTLPPSWHAHSNVGELFSRIDGDVAELQRFGVDALLGVINSTLTVLLTVALMATLSWQLTLLALAIIPVQLVFLVKIRPRVTRLTRSTKRTADQIGTFLFDSLLAVKFIQASNAELRQVRKLNGLFTSHLKNVLEQKYLGTLSSGIPGLLANLTLVSVFAYGGWKVSLGALTIGTLVAMSSYITRVTEPMNSLLGMFVSLRRIEVSLFRVWDLMATRPLVSRSGRMRPVEAPSSGEISFENVSFAYTARSGKVPIFDDTNLRIPSGAKVGLLGASGSGKTTLADLLVRHYDPDSGSISIGSIDLRDLQLDCLRNLIAIVAQEPTIVEGTVAENIAFLKPEATRSEIMEAARSAQIHSKIEELDEGYDTNLNARAPWLSGGQRQRLAIARALLVSPKVIILDEASSAVDIIAAAAISQEIDRLFPFSTRLVISHHAEPLKGADYLYRIEDMKIVALDNVSELISLSHCAKSYG